MRTIARTTLQFAQLLPPVDQITLTGTSLSDTERRGHAQSLLLAHALAHSAMATLHGVRFSAGDASAINSDLVHATEVLKIIEKVIGDGTKTETGTPGPPAGLVDALFSVRILDHSRYTA